MNSSFCLYAAWTDAALLDALREDQEQAFTEIYKRYCYRLFTVAYRKLKNCEVAEELVQDLFADLWARRSSNQIEQLENYLFTAIRYRIINYIKAQQVKSGYELYCRLSTNEADTDTEKSLAFNDLSEALLASMRKLPEKSREIFQLSRLEHYSVSEISVRVKLSEKSVEYHLTKSLKLLRTYLRDYLLLILPLLVWIH
ncbi:RNA polymerase sigma-70 factor [Hymenobacter volaticus]|uniref:RNA polymerase sigma-70 factor n=1 Tax=Hymenobacter volaticus TaxID=2932254 RepID=A0ABY4GFU5_9BACT|nr:RNA polymerase sigma-70 factor [Hymenobacter volaticus]UOQ69835.1 RNA polymerase sigma-70 factor [Hymenobacter volaticus]